MMFPEVRPISEPAMNILRKRYFRPDETKWEDIVNRVINHVIPDWDEEDRKLMWEMIANTYFVPNSPLLVNAGKKNAGLLACTVLDFKDDIEEIFKTKLQFALVARKGAGAGTTLSKIRPKNSKVNGSTHGYAAGPVNFADTICRDMEIMTQGENFRAMALLLSMSIYHPDIIEFITAKKETDKMQNANISVVIDDSFIQKVINDEEYDTYFDYPSGREYGPKYKAREIFKMISDGAWKNGDPGIIHYDRVNNSSYKYTGEEILSSNPCGEIPAPPNSACNLGSLDLSKFLGKDNNLDLTLLEAAIRLGVRFLDKVIDVNAFAFDEMKVWELNHRPIGLGAFGLADLFLKLKLAYGSKESLDLARFIFKFIKEIAEDESIIMGEELGVPEACKLLPIPRRNVCLMTCPPNGTTAILAGASSGIEPVFSEIIIRNDKTGSYQFENNLAEQSYFRCAVSANGAKEVTWKEHLEIQNAIQEFVDQGISKTVNVPTHTHKDTVYEIFLYAFTELPFIKGVTLYRNQSRAVEVLTPKNLKKDLCPKCGKELERKDNCKKCPDPDCRFSMCEV